MTVPQKVVFAFLLLLKIFEELSAFSTMQFKLTRNNDYNYTVDKVEREENVKYPKKNFKLLIILKKRWKDYYDCLHEKSKIKSKPEIRRLVEGQNTRLHCDICVRPFQNYDELMWKYKPLDPNLENSELEYLDLTPKMTLTENKTLQIFNAIENLAGLYVCYHKKNVVSVYILEVSKNDTMEKVENEQIYDEYLFKEKTPFQILYQWTDWTECSTCGKVGKKYKYGTCFLKLKRDNRLNSSCHTKLRVLKSISQETFFKPRKHSNRNSFKKVKITNIFKNDNKTLNDKLEQKTWGSEIVKTFAGGIPCASSYIPKEVYNLVQKEKSLKVLIKYCWKVCQRDEIFIVSNNLGKLLEIANNTGGLYSVFQKLPKLPPDVERISVIAEFGSNIIIQCPGTLLSNYPVLWKINNKIIFPELTTNASKGRFTIDLVHRINIKKLRLRDSQIYSCWQNGKLIGTVNLNVEKKFKIVFDHHVALVTLLVILGLIIMIGNNIIRKELRMRKK